MVRSMKFEDIEQVKEIDKTSSPISNFYSVTEVNINDENDYSNLKNSLKTLSDKAFNNFDLSSEIYLIKNKSFGTIFELKAGNTTHGIAICHTKPIRKNQDKNLQIKLAIIDSSVDYKAAIDSIIKTCANYAKNIGYKSILIDCNTYNTEICNYLISNHSFKIYHNLVMLLMGNDNPFNSKDVLLLTRLAG